MTKFDDIYTVTTDAAYRFFCEKCGGFCICDRSPYANIWDSSVGRDGSDEPEPWWDNSSPSTISADSPLPITPAPEDLAQGQRLVYGIDALSIEDISSGLPLCPVTLDLPAFDPSPRLPIITPSPILSPLYAFRCFNIKTALSPVLDSLSRPSSPMRWSRPYNRSDNPPSPQAPALGLSGIQHPPAPIIPRPDTISIPPSLTMLTPSTLPATPPVVSNPSPSIGHAPSPSPRSRRRTSRTAPYPSPFQSSSPEHVSPPVSPPLPAPSPVPASPRTRGSRTVRRRNIPLDTSESAETIARRLVAAGNWKCPASDRGCRYVQLGNREPDFVRHIEIHTREKQWVCCGVPVADAPADLALGRGIRGKKWVYEGIEMIGGCRRAVSRKDALLRHLQNPNCRCVRPWYLHD